MPGHGRGRPPRSALVERVAVAGRGEAAHDRDAEGTADLAGRVVHG